jgi:hypothetical protein
VLSVIPRGATKSMVCEYGVVGSEQASKMENKQSSLEVTGHRRQCSHDRRSVGSRFPHSGKTRNMGETNRRRRSCLSCPKEMGAFKQSAGH